jgi:hypothetical protein
MTKKDIVALAEAIRTHNRTADGRTEFTPDHLQVLADFCASQDPNFNRQLWIDYIAREGRPGDESISVESDCMLIPDASVEDRLVPKVNLDEGSAKGGLAGDC